MARSVVAKSGRRGCNTRPRGEHTDYPHSHGAGKIHDLPHDQHLRLAAFLYRAGKVVIRGQRGNLDAEIARRLGYPDRFGFGHVEGTKMRDVCTRSRRPSNPIREAWPRISSTGSAGPSYQLPHIGDAIESYLHRQGSPRQARPEPVASCSPGAISGLSKAALRA